MRRREYILTCGLALLSGCTSGLNRGSDTASVVSVLNDRETGVEASIRLKDGERMFAIEDVVVESGEAATFDVEFPNVGSDMTVSVQMFTQQKKLYEQTSVPVGVPEYNVSIRSDEIIVVWPES